MMEASDKIKFLQELKQAIESGKGVDYGFDGEDEFGYETFEAHYAIDAVIELLKKWNIIDLTTSKPQP